MSERAEKLTKASQDWYICQTSGCGYIIILIFFISSKLTTEVVHGLMGQVIKDQLFNKSMK